MKVRTMALAGVALVALVALAVLAFWQPSARDVGAARPDEPLPHELYVLAEDLVLSPGETFTSSYVDTRGCPNAELTMRWSANPLPTSNAQLRYSMDGLMDDELIVQGLGGPGTTQSVFLPAEQVRRAFPFTRVQRLNDSPIEQSLTAFLYCYP